MHLLLPICELVLPKGGHVLLVLGEQPVGEGVDGGARDPERFQVPRIVLRAEAARFAGGPG